MRGGAGAARWRGGARGAGCARSDAPRRATRLPSVARRLRLCLCDSRRSVHRTRAPITTRAALPWPRTRPLRYRRIVFPNFRATCYDLTFGHLRFLTRLVYPLIIVEPRTAPACSLTAEPLISLFSRPTVACPDPHRPPPSCSHTKHRSPSTKINRQHRYERV